MLIALESGEEKQIQDATKDVLDACTFNKLKIEELPTFDIEYMFLQIRAKSVGEISKFKVKLLTTEKSKIEIDLSKVEVQVDGTSFLTNLVFPGFSGSAILCLIRMELISPETMKLSLSLFNLSNI